MQPTTNPLELSPVEIDHRIGKLSPRQMDAITHFAQGMNNKQIGMVLGIGGKTVKTHIRRACRSVGVDNRIQLVVMFAIWASLHRDNLKQETMHLGTQYCGVGVDSLKV